MKPQVVAWELGQRLAEDAIISCDSGTITTWWARYIPAKRGQMHSVSGTMASMACGLTYAMAAQIAHPDRQCVAFVGDGGFSMLMADFVTCVKYQLPINTFNGKFSYRIVYWTLRFHGQLFFTHIELDLHDVEQTAPNHIEAHWTVKGTLRLPWKPTIYFNGTSNYSINSEGLIYKHVDAWDRKPTEVLKQFFKQRQE